MVIGAVTVPNGLSVYSCFTSGLRTVVHPKLDVVYVIVSPVRQLTCHVARVVKKVKPPKKKEGLCPTSLNDIWGGPEGRDG